jgi:hypothetical protein
MNIVYNSNHYHVVEYPGVGGYELIDKQLGVGGYLQGEVTRCASTNVATGAYRYFAAPTKSPRGLRHPRGSRMPTSPPSR